MRTGGLGTSFKPLQDPQHFQGSFPVVIQSLGIPWSLPRGEREPDTSTFNGLLGSWRQESYVTSDNPTYDY